MDVKIISRRRAPRPVTLKLTDGSVLKGQVNLYYEEMELNRVSDLFTKDKDPFLVLFDVVMQGKTEQVYIINKQHIVWLTPED
ncbi:MAG: hypothetical protein AB1424_06955 [Thermodesulfobacteriota bacterium]